MSAKDINIKNHTYYFFDDIINKKILIQIRYIQMDDESHAKISLFSRLDM